MGIEQFEGRAGRVIGRLSKQLEVALTEVDLSLPQYRLLGWLEEAPQASGRLAEQMAVTPPSITALVDGLVHRGLVERKADPSDRRRLPLHLTDAGRHALSMADGVVEARLDGVLGHLGDREAASAVKGLTAWASGLDRHRAAKLGKVAAR